MAKYDGLSGKDKLLAVLADQGRMIAAAPSMAEALELVDKRMTSYVPLDLPDDVAGDSMYAAYFSSDDLAVIEAALAILRGENEEGKDD